jgi:hypothetical protein
MPYRRFALHPDTEQGKIRKIPGYIIYLTPKTGNLTLKTEGKRDGVKNQLIF